MLSLTVKPQPKFNLEARKQEAQKEAQQAIELKKQITGRTIALIKHLTQAKAKGARLFNKALVNLGFSKQDADDYIEIGEAWGLDNLDRLINLSVLEIKKYSTASYKAFRRELLDKYLEPTSTDALALLGMIKDRRKLEKKLEKAASKPTPTNYNMVLKGRTPFMRIEVHDPGVYNRIRQLLQVEPSLNKLLSTLIEFYLSYQGVVVTA